VVNIDNGFGAGYLAAMINARGPRAPRRARRGDAEVRPSRRCRRFHSGEADTHKGTYGRLLLVAGSEG